VSDKKNKKIKEFELSKEFQEKYPDITSIMINGKNLIFTTYQNKTVCSKYYEDDIMKTIAALKKEFLDNADIEISFTDESMKQFTKEVTWMLTRESIGDAQNGKDEEKKEVKAKDNPKIVIIEQIEQLRQQHKDITFEEWRSKLLEKYQELKDTINDSMPEIWSGLEFGLSILRILNIKNCTLPFIGLLLGRPSSYKSVDIELIDGWYNTYYSDKFTPKSFVSHSTAAKSEDELRMIDMLPRIKGRIFLTPELSPIFTTREEELTELLGIITRIADGHGFYSDSGVHGHRGYGDTMFTWLGAVVDIPYRAYKVLNNLGHRLYFYRLYFRDESIDELLEYAEGENKESFNDKKARIKTTLYNYLKWFEVCPSLQTVDYDNNNRKIEWDHSRNDREAIKIIAGMADLLSYLRCVARVWENDDNDTEGTGFTHSISQREVPRRALTVLLNLAKGHALLKGRNYITMDDVGIIVKTATDSARTERVSLFNLLLAYNGSLTTNQILNSLSLDRKFTLRTMEEFKAIGLVDMQEFHEQGQNNISKKIVLKQHFNWLLEDPEIKKIFSDVTIQRIIHEDTSDNDDVTIKDKTVGHHREFWLIYNELERQNNNGKIIGHKELHNALVGSGKFIAGEATQTIRDMLKEGKLNEMSFEQYKRG
jgi:hypothetical protein